MEETKRQRLISSGVDLAGALERFMNNEKLYDNFLHKFAVNPNFTELETAVTQNHWDDALSLSHNLKGTAGSLGFTRLYELLSAQVDMLRRDDNASARSLMEEIMAEYHRLLEVTAEIIGQEGF